jgi:sulfur carrier protein
MVVIVKLIDGSRIWRVGYRRGLTIREILGSLGLLSNEYVVAKNGKIVTEDEEVGDGDEIVLYPVVSGG